MRIRLTAAFVIAAALASTSAPIQAKAQDTTAQTSDDGGPNSDLIWNVIGCLGLLGLRGFWRDSDNDGYTDDPI